MKICLQTILCVFLFCASVRCGEESSPYRAFWCESVGMVTLGTDSVGNGAVYLAPQRGPSIRIANASPAEWKNREGHWAEVEGIISWNGNDIVFEVWEFSLEEHPPRPGKAPMESEGVLEDGAASERVLRTRNGSVRMAGTHRLLHDSSAINRKVDVSGELAVDNGELLLHVQHMEID